MRILAVAAVVFAAGCQKGSDSDDPIAPIPPPQETEANDSIGTAQLLGPGAGPHQVSGKIDPIGDDDYFAIDVLVGSIITVDLTGLPADYDLELYDEAAGVAAA